MTEVWFSRKLFVFNVYLHLFIYRVYQGTRPTLIIADPDLIRDLFIKEFGNFTNRPVSFMMEDKQLLNYTMYCMPIVIPTRKHLC